MIKNSIIISPDYEQDEYEQRPPLKRSIIDITLDYYEINVFPSNPVGCYEVPQFEVNNIINLNKTIEDYNNG